MTNKKPFVVIMAGGSGERFWPVSRSNRPKQLLPLMGKKTLIQETVDRALKVTRKEKILIITNEEHVLEIRKQLPKLNRENIIGEPVGRDTAPCIALASAIVARKDPNAVMVIMPADHKINNEKELIKALNDAVDICRNNPYLITTGIKPRFPHTGYGYIKFDKKLSFKAKTSFYDVDKFEEKPNKKKAESFIKQGNYYWNSGMFVWKVSDILYAFKQHHQDLYRASNRLMKAYGKANFKTVVRNIYRSIEKISIDYAVMEKASNVISAKAFFSWSDVGSWTSLDKYYRADTDGNISDGEVIHDQTVNSTIISKNGIVACLGIKNAVIVKTDDAVLVCHKSCMDDIKSIVSKIKSSSKLKKYT